MKHKFKNSMVAISMAAMAGTSSMPLPKQVGGRVAGHDMSADQDDVPGTPQARREIRQYVKEQRTAHLARVSRGRLLG